MNEKPVCELSQTDGNIFALMGKCRQTLARAGQSDKAKEMTARVIKAQSYDEALQIMMEYVEVE